MCGVYYQSNAAGGTCTSAPSVAGDANAVTKADWYKQNIVYDFRAEIQANVKWQFEKVIVIAPQACAHVLLHAYTPYFVQ